MFINKNDSPIAYFRSDLTTRAALLLCVLGIFFIGLLSPVYEFIKMLSIGM